MININQIIRDLFPDKKTVSAIKIVDYLQWVSDSELESPNHQKLEKILAMPPIQRGFIWKPYQIQDLWDSLIRGMPIGSILIKTFNQGELGFSTCPDDRKVSHLNKSGFHLIDGQQRTLAMALGFPGSIVPKHKLWIDFSEWGKRGSKFQFRITTEAQPFGYQPDGRGRLSMHDRREARKAWDGGDENKEKMSNKDIYYATAKPWKMGGSKQNYFFEVKYLWQWLNACDQDIKSWSEKVKAEIKEENVNDKVLNERIVEFGNALKELQNQWLALIKIPEDKIKNDRELEDPSHDYLTMLFDRISSNGTRLSPDDLLFSMVKQSWPEAHNIVYKIHERVGSLMKPTDFIMTAYRLASLKEGIADEAQPNARSFHKNLGKLLGTEKQPGKLKELISESNKSSPLVKAFEDMKLILKYRGENDNGIPEAMFPYLDVSLQQAVLFWLLDNKEDRIINQRQNIISFVLFWMLCNKGASSKYEASKNAFEIISGHKEYFPLVNLYDELTKNESDNKPSIFCRLISPPDIKPDNTFREPYDRAAYYFGNNNAQLYLNFSDRKELLLWLQRNWVNNEFDFEPLAGQDEDNVPDLWPRRKLGNSIGNYRIMTATDNRRRNDTSLELELIKIQSEKDQVSTINCTNNYAFEPNEYELEQWKKASPENKLENKTENWDDERVLAFQYAVESRVLYLYNRCYREAGFNSWLSNSFLQ